MPSEKSARSSERRRIRNRSIRSKTRTIVSRAVNAIEQEGLGEARPALCQALRVLDRAAQRGILHPNNAARRKSRLMARVNKHQQDS